MSSSVAGASARKLFAILLGGRVEGGNIEVHDVVFAAATAIEDTYPSLPAKWFGKRKGLHVDAFQVVDMVDGYSVQLRETAATDANKLWFVNVGGYGADQLQELHASTFVVAATRMSAKMKGRAKLRDALPGRIHVDDVIDVDDCFALTRVDDLYVVLEHGASGEPSKPVAAYTPLK